ncbi:MAG: hypothetical protein LBK65_01235 [Tannerellaceae bacterium]|jgi:hypothetical protein|nr:hypothetical protein [Tannerellaceae bacterium]
MKKIARALLFACLAGCTPVDAPSYPQEVEPAGEVVDAFGMLYPEAENTSWDFERGSYIARFTLSSGPAYAWFNTGGDWLLSAREQSRWQLSGELSAAFSGSAYADWDLKKVNLLERLRMGALYIFSVAEDGRHASIYYSRLGDLVKVDNASEDAVQHPVTIPQEIFRTVDSLFNKSEIIDMWRGELSINVAVMDDNDVCRFAAFSDGYDWLCSIWDIERDVIPENVRDAFGSSEYRDNPVSRTQLLQNDDEVMYLFHFTDNNNKRRIIGINEKGFLQYIITY